jgi:capsular exopolysaccharide synthesis family protein
MSIDEIGSIFWRRRFTFAVVLAAAVAAVIAGTLTLPKVYAGTATLFVGDRETIEALGFNANIGEELTRTYTTLAANANVAEEVVDRLPAPMTRGELLERMSFTPVEQTQLLQISAEGATPAEAQTIANTYADVFVERMEDRFAQGRIQTDVFVSEPAALPLGPSKPNPPLYIGFGTLLALLLASGVALLRERLDTRVRVAPEDDTVLSEPIMARIPRMEVRDGAVSREIADRFGLLKTNVDFFDENPARVLVVTSPGVSEGKSTVAANLALACARAGERVVLVEADLRRPGLDGTLVAHGLLRSPVGLSNYLAAAATEEEILVSHPDHPELSVIWSGHVPPNPTALLGSHRLDTLIGTLRLDFDRVIIDTCPISVAADASVVASRTDGALYIIDERKTKRSEAQAGLNQLRSVRARLLGVVLNRAAVHGETYYYYSPDGSPNGSESLVASSRRDDVESF